MSEQEIGVSSPAAADDLKSLLSSSDRDFLIKYNGDEVKVDSLKQKKIGLYFSASWCGPCQQFTPILAEAYNELLSNGDFEIIFISADEDDEAFEEYFQEMPWLAIPFTDTETREALDKLFSVNGIPYLVILDENLKVLSDDGVDIIREYGSEGFPFTLDRIKELKEYEEAAKRDQSLKSILTSRSRDYVIAADGKNTPISELEGKMIGLYFSSATYGRSVAFTGKLNEVYKELKEKGEDFEIVTIPFDEDEEEYKQGSENMTWFSLPVKDKSCQKLVEYFELNMLPTLVIIGPDGKTRHPNVAEAVEEHGVLAYPFTPEKFAELEEIEKAKLENQTLESILVSGDRDFVIGKDGVKVPVADLVGKNILLSFSAHWCPPCRAFLPTLVEAYHKIKAKDDAFEIIFISSDTDQASFDDYYSEMPWLALPYGDERKQKLSSTFKVRGIPTLVAIGPTGKTVTTSARSLIMEHGAEAYPFTEERMKEIESEIMKGWPEKIKHVLHEEHELILTKRMGYVCDGCDEPINGWSYCCGECDFDLDPKCALEDKKESEDEESEDEESEDEEVEEKKPNEEGGMVCDGDVCYRA